LVGAVKLVGECLRFLLYNGLLMQYSLYLYDSCHRLHGCFKFL